MYRLERPEMLYLLAILPVVWILYFLYMAWKKKKLKLFSDLELTDNTIPLYTTNKLMIKTILLSMVFSFLVMALANPQIGSKLQEVKREGVDVMIALDLSNSMLAEDFSPNRLEKSKRAISKLVDRLKSDRIGIVVFGGEAYTQLPLTSDYAAAKLFLRTVNTDIIPTQGTAIGTAIELCEESFDKQSKAGKAIIIITDGENHEDDATGAASNATEQDIKVFTVGMGSTQGVPIPVYQGGRRTGYRKDKDGNSIVTRLNEEMLQEIAAAGNGMYIRASNSGSGLDIIMDELESMEKSEYGTKIFTDYEDRFQYPLGVALFFLLIELLIYNRKSQWIRDLKLFESGNKI
jgi:Ca-activated chloride channel family protein